MRSWDEAFGERYEEWSASTTADIPFYVELARQADGLIVELGIGSGRVAIPVAQATGQRVIGIDSSPAMLGHARVLAAKASVELDLREGDMRDLALAEPAALIYCPFNALLHLPTWSDRRRAFERVAAALQPAGRFAWNALAFDHHIAADLDGKHRDAPVPHTNWYAVGDNRIDIIDDDGAKSSMWWATKNEWLGLIDVAGLEVEALYGGFAHEPLTDDSRHYVFVTRHPSPVSRRIIRERFFSSVVSRRYAPEPAQQGTMHVMGGPTPPHCVPGGQVPVLQQGGNGVEPPLTGLT